jgi:hypothetical protein
MVVEEYAVCEGHDMWVRVEVEGSLVWNEKKYQKSKK